MGNSGSGKSTLAERLGEKFSLPVRHLDRILWHANWEYCDAERFAPRHDAWVTESAWLIEGVGHWDALLRRFAAAEMIVFLDTPRELCVERAKRRMSEDSITPNRFIADGCRYAAVAKKQWEVIDYFDASLRPAVLKLLAEDFRAKPQIILNGTLSIEELVAML